MRNEEAYYEEEEEEKSNKKSSWTRNFYNFFSREEDYEDEYENEEEERTYSKKQVITIWNDVKSLNDAKSIIEKLRDGAPQIVNFENSPEEVAVDIRNFLYGAVYSLDANIGKISEKNIILTPKNISIDNSSSKIKMGAFRINGSNF